jgi:hypothetical protein
MTSGEFKLSPVPCVLASSLQETLRRCRSYLSDDVHFMHRLPAETDVVRVDLLRLSQILSNSIRSSSVCVCVCPVAVDVVTCCASSNAGKFVAAGGIVDVDVKVVDDEDLGRSFLVLTVSNSCTEDSVVKEGDKYFVPFKGRKSAADDPRASKLSKL